MIDRKDYYHFGKILKLHGFNGHFLLRAETTTKPKLKKPEPIFLDVEGILVPFFILEFVHTSGDAYLLLLEGIENETLAREYTGCDVYLPATMNIPEEKSSDDLNLLIGYKLYDSNRVFIGMIEEIIQIPQNNLFRVVNNKQEYLLPANIELFIEINMSAKELDYNLPEGLLDI